MTRIFTDWPQQTAALFSKHTVKLNHSLPTHPLFSDDALAALIDRTPREHYHLVTMGAPGEPRHLWRQGEIGDTPGREVIDAVRRGRMWINIIRVSEFAPDYAAVLKQMFGEMEENVPTFRSFRQKMGILISSPNAQVYYHCDIPGQSLWQVRGRKRIWIYPAAEPFLDQQRLEGIFMGETEEEISYEPWYDEHAVAYDLEPGEMLHWPLNGPHRVVNHDVMNVSVTTEHMTDEIRRYVAVVTANGIMRRRMGLNPRSTRTEGPEFYAKLALKRAYEVSGLGKKRAVKRIVDWRLDTRGGELMRPITAYAL